MRLDNPVLNRELIENLRSPRAFIMQAIFILALGGVVVVAWPPEMELGLQAEISRKIYQTFAWGQFVLLALLAPVLSAPSVAGERERKSFDLLLTSPLSPTDIVWGKLLSALVYLLLLAFSSLPVFACCLLLGAVGGRLIASTYAFLFAEAYACGAIGLAASTFIGRSRNALAVSYVVILPAAMVLIFANPIFNVPAIVTLSLFLALVGTVLLVLAQRRLRKPFDQAPVSADEENLEEQIGLVIDRRRFPDSLLSPRGSGQPLDESGNPAYEKELRFELFGQGTLLIRFLLQASLVAALPFFIAALATNGLWLYGYYILVFTILIAPALTAGVFTQERERGTLDLLTTTALGADRIIRGKLLSSLRSIGMLIMFLLPFMLMIWALSVPIREKVGVFYMTAGTGAVLLSTAVFVVLLSAFFSLVCRTTLRSMVGTYVTLALLFILPVVLHIVLVGLAGANLTDAGWLGGASPFFTLASFEAGEYRAGTFFLPLPNDAAGGFLAFYLLFSLGGSSLLLAGLYRLFSPLCQHRHDRGM
jgi:ABC-type transport system involved in multi-copper enzyme maturation permease subunit